MLLTNEQIEKLREALKTEKFTDTSDYYSYVSAFTAGMRAAYIFSLSAMHDQLRAHSRLNDDCINLSLKLSIRDVINLYNQLEGLKNHEAIADLFEDCED